MKYFSATCFIFFLLEVISIKFLLEFFFSLPIILTMYQVHCDPYAVMEDR